MNANRLAIILGIKRSCLERRQGDSVFYYAFSPTSLSAVVSFGDRLKPFGYKPEFTDWWTDGVVAVVWFKLVKS